MAAKISIEQVITITKAAALVIEAVVLTTKHLQENKALYTEFFNTALKFMDVLEFDKSPLSGTEKKTWVLAKMRDVAFEQSIDWGSIGNILVKLIDDFKAIYNTLSANYRQVKTTLADLK